MKLWFKREWDRHLHWSWMAWMAFAAYLACNIIYQFDFPAVYYGNIGLSLDIIGFLALAWDVILANESRRAASANDQKILALMTSTLNEINQKIEGVSEQKKQFEVHLDNKIAKLREGFSQLGIDQKNQEVQAKIESNIQIKKTIENDFGLLRLENNVLAASKLGLFAQERLNKFEVDLNENWKTLGQLQYGKQIQNGLLEMLETKVNFAIAANSQSLQENSIEASRSKTRTKWAACLIVGGFVLQMFGNHF